MPTVNLTSMFNFKATEYLSAKNGYLFRVSYMEDMIKHYGFMFVPKAQYASLLMLDFYLSNKLEMSAEVQEAMERELQAELSAEKGIVVVSDVDKPTLASLQPHNAKLVDPTVPGEKQYNRTSHIVGTNTQGFNMSSVNRDAMLDTFYQTGVYDNVHQLNVANNVFLSKRLIQNDMTITEDQVAIRVEGNNLFIDLATDLAERPITHSMEVTTESATATRKYTHNLSVSQGEVAVRKDIHDLHVATYVEKAVRDIYSMFTIDGDSIQSDRYEDHKLDVILDKVAGVRGISNDMGILALHTEGVRKERKYDTFVDTQYVRAVRSTSRNLDLIREGESDRTTEGNLYVGKDVRSSRVLTNPLDLIMPVNNLGIMKVRQYPTDIIKGLFGDRVTSYADMSILVEVLLASKNMAAVRKIRQVGFDFIKNMLATRTKVHGLDVTTVSYSSDRANVFNLDLDKELLRGDRPVTHDMGVNNTAMSADRPFQHGLYVGHTTTAVRDNLRDLTLGEQLLGSLLRRLNLSVGSGVAGDRATAKKPLYFAKDSTAGARVSLKGMEFEFGLKSANGSGAKGLYLPSDLSVGSRDSTHDTYIPTGIASEKAAYPAVMDDQYVGVLDMRGEGFFNQYDIFATNPKERAAEVTEENVWAFLDRVKEATFMEEVLADKGHEGYEMVELIFADLLKERVGQPIEDVIFGVRQRLNAFIEEGVVYSEKEGKASIINDGLFAIKSAKDSFIDNNQIISGKYKEGFIDDQLVAVLAPEEATIDTYTVGELQVKTGLVEAGVESVISPNVATIEEGDVSTLAPKDGVIQESTESTKGTSHYAEMNDGGVAGVAPSREGDYDELFSGKKVRDGVVEEPLVGTVDSRGGVKQDGWMGMRPEDFAEIFQDFANPAMRQQDFGEMLESGTEGEVPTRTAEVGGEKLAYVKDRLAALVSEYVLGETSIQRAAALSDLMDLAGKSYDHDAILSEEGYSKIASTIIRQGLITEDMLGESATYGVQIMDALVGSVDTRDAAIECLEQLGQIDGRVAEALYDKYLAVKSDRQALKEQLMEGELSPEDGYLPQDMKTAYGLLFDNTDPTYQGVPVEYSPNNGTPTFEGSTPTGNVTFVTEDGKTVAVPMSNRWYVGLDALNTIIEQVIEQYLKDKTFYSAIRCEQALYNMRARLDWWVRNQLRLSDHDYTQAMALMDSCIQKVLAANTVGATTPTKTFYADFNDKKIFPNIGSGIFSQNPAGTWMIGDDPFDKNQGEDWGVFSDKTMTGQQSFFLNFSTSNPGTISFQFYLYNPHSYAIGEFFIDGQQVFAYDNTAGGNFVSTYQLPTAGNHTFEWRYTNNVMADGSYFYLDVITVTEEVPGDPAQMACPAPITLHPTGTFHNDFDQFKPYAINVFKFDSSVQMSDMPPYFVVGGSMETVAPDLVHGVGGTFGTDNLVEFDPYDMDMGQESNLTLTWYTKNKATISFDYLADCNKGNGLVFFINGQQVGGEWSQSNAWQTVTFTLPNVGETDTAFTFKWIVRKQNDLQFGSEKVYVRNVSVDLQLDPTFIDPVLYDLIGGSYEGADQWGIIPGESKIKTLTKDKINTPVSYEIKLNNECDGQFSFGYSLGQALSDWHKTDIDTFFSDLSKDTVSSTSPHGSVADGTHKKADGWMQGVPGEEGVGTTKSLTASYHLQAVPNAEYEIDGSVEIVCPPQVVDHKNPRNVPVSITPAYPWYLDANGCLAISNPGVGTFDTSFTLSNINGGYFTLNCNFTIPEGDSLKIIVGGVTRLNFGGGTYSQPLTIDMSQYGTEDVMVTLEYIHSAPPAPLPADTHCFSYGSNLGDMYMDYGTHINVQRKYGSAPPFDATYKPYAVGTSDSVALYTVTVPQGYTLDYTGKVAMAWDASAMASGGSLSDAKMVDGKWRDASGNYLQPPTGSVLFRSSFNGAWAGSDITYEPPQDYNTSNMTVAPSWTQESRADSIYKEYSGDGFIYTDQSGQNDVTISYDSSAQAVFSFRTGGLLTGSDAIYVIIDNSYTLTTITSLTDDSVGDTYNVNIPAGSHTITLRYVNGSSTQVVGSGGGQTWVPGGSTDILDIDYSKSSQWATSPAGSKVNASEGKFVLGGYYAKTSTNDVFVTRSIDTPQGTTVTYSETIQVNGKKMTSSSTSGGYNAKLGDLYMAIPYWQSTYGLSGSGWYNSEFDFTMANDGKLSLQLLNHGMYTDWYEFYILPASAPSLPHFQSLDGNDDPFGRNPDYGSRGKDWSSGQELWDDKGFTWTSKSLKAGSYKIVARMKWRSGVLKMNASYGEVAQIGGWLEDITALYNGTTTTTSALSTDYAVIQPYVNGSAYGSPKIVRYSDNPQSDQWGDSFTSYDYYWTPPSGSSAMVQITYYTGSNPGGLVELKNGKFTENTMGHYEDTPPTPTTTSSTGGGHAWLDTMVILAPEYSTASCAAHLTIWDNNKVSATDSGWVYGHAFYVNNDGTEADYTISGVPTLPAGSYTFQWSVDPCMVTAKLSNECFTETPLPVTLPTPSGTICNIVATGYDIVYGGGCQGSTFTINLVNEDTGLVVQSIPVTSSGSTDFTFAIPEQTANTKYRVDVSFTQNGGQKTGLNNAYYDTGWIHSYTVTETFHYPPPEFAARLEFYIDDQLQATYTQMTGEYATAQFPVSAGTHSYRFVFYELSDQQYDYAEIGWVDLTNWYCKSYTFNPYCKKGSGSKCVEDLIRCLLNTQQSKQPIQIDAVDDIWLFLM